MLEKENVVVSCGGGIIKDKKQHRIAIEKVISSAKGHSEKAENVKVYNIINKERS